MTCICNSIQFTDSKIKIQKEFDKLCELLEIDDNDFTFSVTNISDLFNIFAVMNFVSNYKKLLRKLLFYLGEPSWIKKIQNRGNVIEATHQTMLDFGIIEYRPSFDIIEKNITAQYETILHKFIIEELKKSMD
ncbi:hypothetical protein RFI_10944 [Reticulomyxa filosa]|uniref:Uncharacterized protein n=1 Tax=Reticulomyxa filosa TaxID=46433 RepID=X6NLD5_RETFI|nr:hypothetical protein RFI_10944 [Reticulomyxa filosa]|eukprot:ETO26192.1 hypothetical protein RFI_10944 [Reticulomyxa filosa]